MTDALHLIAICSAVWVVLALAYGIIAYRAGYLKGHTDALEYARRHIELLGK